MRKFWKACKAQLVELVFGIAVAFGMFFIFYLVSGDIEYYKLGIACGCFVIAWWLVCVLEDINGGDKDDKS